MKLSDKIRSNKEALQILDKMLELVVHNSKTQKQYTVASLFAGIGGVDLAFKNAGFEISWANEIDKKACETYTKNFNHNIICDDIKNLVTDNIQPVDIITAGFPCQAFSIAGYQKGFEDDRGSIFFDLMQIVQQIKPRVLFLENVKNLASHKNGATFEHILNLLKKQKYHIKYQILNTCDYSELPQNRERVYIVCFKNKQDCNEFCFPEKISFRKSIKDMLQFDISNEYYYTNTRYYEQLKQEITNKETCYQWRRHYVRENKNNLCPTLTANMGTGGHNVPLILDNKGIRKLTPRECARLQGFPDEFIFPEFLPKSALYKQIGNSVSVPVIEAIARNILIALNK
jgi:DNA (cytosine-5)-methyltransferase 1